ncbi:hypothetical protein Q3G72_003537 [Acer saccharum]|nr:hypothetical protein Q3G72_003537 [Acer saccharum]
MTTSTKKLDHILGGGKNPCDKRGIGYEESKEITTPTKTVFVKSLGKIEASPVHTPRKKIDLGQCSKSAQVKEAPRRQPQAQKVPQPNFPQAHIHQGKRPIMQNGSRKQARTAQPQSHGKAPMHAQGHGVGSAVRWSSSAGPAQPTSADRPVVCRWSCAGRPAQPTSAHEKWSMRWWCAGRPAQADQRTTHNQVRFFKTTSLY